MRILERQGEHATDALAAAAHPRLDVGVCQHGASAKLDPCAGTALLEETAVTSDLQAKDHRRADKPAWLPRPITEPRLAP